jgi:hypothetical protein
VVRAVLWGGDPDTDIAQIEQKLILRELDLIIDPDIPAPALLEENLTLFAEEAACLLIGESAQQILEIVHGLKPLVRKVLPQRSPRRQMRKSFPI